MSHFKRKIVFQPSFSGGAYKYCGIFFCDVPIPWVRQGFPRKFENSKIQKIEKKTKIQKFENSKIQKIEKPRENSKIRKFEKTKKHSKIRKFEKTHWNSKFENSITLGVLARFLNRLCRKHVFCMTKTVFCIRRLSYYFGGPETYSCVNHFKRDDGTFILVGLARDCVRNSDNLVICESSFGCFLCAIYFAMLCSRGNWKQLDGRQTIDTP